MNQERIAKRILLLVLLLAVLAIGSGCGSKIRIYNIEPASEATVNMGAGWSVGNTLDAFNTSIVSRSPSATETCWGNPVITKELIKTIAEAGFTTIRIPVTWKGHIDANGNIDEAWLDRVQEVVDYCYAYKLYVIINVHHDTGADEKEAWVIADTSAYNQSLSTFKNLWTQIANRFAGYDGHLLFEGYNEMLDKDSTWNYPKKEESYDIVNKWAQIFVDAVRATGGNNANRNLIVSTYASSFQEKCLANFKLPNDTAEDHLIVQIHLYTPYEFCDGEVGVVNKHTVFTSEYEAFVDKCFRDIKLYFVDYHIPVIVGEFAATNKNNTAERIKYVQCYVKKCKEIGAAYVWWDNGAKKDMGLFSRSTYECWFPEIVAEIVK